MTKNRNFSNKNIMLIVGIALIIMGLIGIGNLINILLIVIGGYILWDVLKNK